MEQASSSSSTGWEVIPSNQDIPVAVVPEVMAGSFCREKQISNILEVKADESDYLLRFKDGSEEWVANEELDETTKEFFKLAKPVKRALNIHSTRKQIKIEHVQTKMIHKISTSGINNVQELKKRYTDNAGSNVDIDLYVKDVETEQLMILAPETVLPLMATKVYASNKHNFSSSAENSQCAAFSPKIASMSLASIPSLEMDEKEKMLSIAAKSRSPVSGNELTTTEAAGEVFGAVGGRGGRGIARDGIGAWSGGSAAPEDVPVAQKQVAPRVKVTDSICAKMSDEQRMRLAIKMSEGTLTCQDLEDAMNSRQAPVGGGNVLKQMVSAFTDFLGGKASAERDQVNEPESKNPEPRADLVQASLAPPTSVPVNDSIHMYESKEASAVNSEDEPEVIQIYEAKEASVKSCMNKSQEVLQFEAKAVDQEQKPVEEPEEVFDIVIEAKSVKKSVKRKPQVAEDARPIIHAQPVYDNSPDNLNEWLQSLAKINVKEEMHTAVAEKIVEIEIAHAIKLSEMENRHKILVSSLKEIIKRQESERSELVLMMKEYKKALLTAIEARLDEAHTKFEHNHQSFFRERNKQLETLNKNLEKQALSSVEAVEERKVAVFEKLEQSQANVHEKKQNEPVLVIHENLSKIQIHEPVAAVKEAPEPLNCPGEHGLKKILHKDDKICCDRCSEMVKENTEIRSCRICNYDICAQCSKSQQRAKSDVETGELSPQEETEMNKVIETWLGSCEVKEFPVSGPAKMYVPRLAVTDARGHDVHDSKEEDDVEVKIVEEAKKPSQIEPEASNIVEDEKDEEIILMNSMVESLELANVEMTKGGFISEPMEVSVEMKNVGAVPIQCLASLTSIRDSCGLLLIGFKTSTQDDKKVIRLDLAPGDIFAAVIEFKVPYIMEAKKYDFEWQLNEYQTGEKVGPTFSLKDVQLYKALDIPEQEDKVRRLCSMGLGTREEVIQALDSNNWDLNQAVNDFFPQ